MKKAWLKLAGELMKEAADEFSNHGCNDWHFPSKWTKTEKQEFFKAVRTCMIGEGELNEDDEDIADPYLVDWEVMRFFAAQFTEMSLTVEEKTARKAKEQAAEAKKKAKAQAKKIKKAHARHK